MLIHKISLWEPFLKSKASSYKISTELGRAELSQNLAEKNANKIWRQWIKRWSRDSSYFPQRTHLLGHKSHIPKLDLQQICCIKLSMNDSQVQVKDLLETKLKSKKFKDLRDTFYCSETYRIQNWKFEDLFDVF